MPAGLPNASDWVERAASVIVAPTTRTATRKRLENGIGPELKSHHRRQTPADRAAVSLLLFTFGFAAVLGLTFYVTLVMDGSIPALELELINPYLNGFVGVATIVGTALALWRSVSRK